MARVIALACLLTAFGLPLEAHAAGWLVCNRTSEPLQVAIAYHDGPNGWLTEGWWGLNPCGGCARVMNHSQTDGTNVFLSAVTRDGSARVDGEARFCVSDHAKGAPPWTGRSGKTCGPGYVSRGFAKQVIDTEKDFTTNVRGNTSSARCVD